MITLHRYILRELLTTFVLTALATTALFTMAGGIYNVVRQDGVGAAEVFTLLPMLIPVFLPITTSVAALFAVTIVFGRLAADNEFTACRAAGINIFRLFLAPMLLAIFVALSTILTMNYVMPGRLAAIRQYLKNNIHGVAEAWFQTKGFVRFGTEYFVTAQKVESRFDEQELAARGWDPELEYFSITKPSFLRLDDDGEIIQFVTAESGWVMFDTDADPVEVSAIVTDARDFSAGRVALVEQQTIGPIPVPLPFRENPSLLDLNRLIEIHAEPWRFSELAKAFEQFRGAYLRQSLLHWAREELAAGGTLALVDRDGHALKVSGRPLMSDETDRLGLRDIVVRSSDPEPTRPSLFEAPRALLAPVAGREHMTIRLLLFADDTGAVNTTHPGSPHFTAPRIKEEATLDGIQPPDALVTAAAQLDPRVVIASDAALPLVEPVTTELRGKLQRDAATLQREVIATLNYRFGFAISPLVTVVMGAALGMIFRGARALSAFALAAIPFGLAFMLITVGYKNAEKIDTQMMGIAVIWGGLAAIGVANLILMRWRVRR